MLTPAQQYIEDRIERVPESGCWIWMRSTSGNNHYGVSCFRSDVMKAHRFAWITYRGPIHDGMFVLHRCDIPQCVNPNHLFLGTMGDNNADKVAKRRHAFGERIGKAKLTDAQVIDIRVDPRSPAAIATDYGVDTQAIWLIKNGTGWTHLSHTPIVRNRFLVHKLSEDDVRAIRRDQRPNTYVAKDYGVHSNTIRAIKLGLTWKHI